MSYECRTCGIDRGGSGMREDGYCIQCGPPKRKTLYRQIDELRAQLAACAASPWRTDVENAPRDGSDVIIAWRLPQFGKDPRPIYQNYASWNGRRFGFRDVAINPEYIVAFAIPNPPQVTT